MTLRKKKGKRHGSYGIRRGIRYRAMAENGGDNDVGEDDRGNTRRIRAALERNI